MRIWRITAKAYATTAFSGLGAQRTGGRFNSVGRKVVYASGSLSLAMLEMLVQAGDRSRLLNHVVLWAALEEDDITRLAPSDLPSDWKALPYRSATQQVGDKWLDSLKSLALAVPSVIVPVEWNYLINPDHPDFSKLTPSPPAPAAFDPRLLV
ncbi:MAG: RES family NAD+ phosphorylase [Rhodothermales bacterium]|nr:RES family NAD+ phosphorylase [Rhodothermales bacterium]MBO6780859.1 RES family NAD+ phosphorylase [Rhodothermales bacterium]